ncbi:MAG TPA: putative lipopolysaccharide heptosyltransferase III [Syntrophales bacterium]|nr:putative lipopolysaccharide heptosyltransferase III [Syntrophales bacterium]HOX93964.1 putative lipopolysaccharide heptosyltransferase III [Syntrophales bacterium]HPI57405.1 putative lipopolysaccharide heptosyltransferase III [Syntrophales bacterium]HPN25469.1 putative lipopolysaccharide heptosyltransferase III [Syntrophales bacterium]HQM29951.1 putative lipopolysaccharide heptosyltransferase III [Syntrophales bacterium]
MADNFKHILVIKLRYLGDVIVTTPVFAALRRHFPGAYIAAAVNKGTEVMLADHPAIDEIFTVERDGNPVRDLMIQLRLIRELREKRFDLAIELTRNDRGAFLAFLSGARRRIGLEAFKRKRIDRHLLFTDLIPSIIGEHMVDRHLRTIEHLGIVPVNREPSLYFRPEDEVSCKRLLKSKGLSWDDPFVVLHPIHRTKYRAWRKGGYAALCDDIDRRWGMKTVLVCAKDAEEIRYVDDIVSLCEKKPLHVGGQLSLKELLALLKRARLFIGIDSGPMHMATGVKTPVLAIFGPQRKELWGPYGKDHTVIQKDWDCVPCTLRGCHDDGRYSRCLDELTTEEVMIAVERKMKQIGAAETSPSRGK